MVSKREREAQFCIDEIEDSIMNTINDFLLDEEQTNYVLYTIACHILADYRTEAKNILLLED